MKIFFALILSLFLNKAIATQYTPAPHLLEAIEILSNAVYEIAPCFYYTAMIFTIKSDDHSQFLYQLHGYWNDQSIYDPTIIMEIFKIATYSLEQAKIEMYKYNY